MSEPAAAPVSNAPTSEPPRVRLGISACLLGQEVRFNGGHKRDAFLTDVFGRYVDWVDVCPEVEIGLGTPRPSMRLVRIGRGEEAQVRLITPETGADHTDVMRAWAARRIAGLAQMDLDGYVLKKDSPSCGMERVKLYSDEGGMPNKEARGIFAEELMSRLPHLPVEEEGRLNDPPLRENFITRVFVHARWREGGTEGWTRASLMRFHERHKFLLMARNQAGMRRLGRLLGDSVPADDLGELARAYRQGLTETMRRAPTRRGHTNVLQHMAGFVSDRLDPADREELRETIERYRLGLLPLIVPITLLRHYVRKQEVAYLQGQVYLEPHPHELMLMNHV